MRIDFVRHGETEWNRVRRVQGRGPTPLNERGREQAARVGERYRGAAVDALYASGLVRAMQTAEPIAGALGKPIVVDDRFAEVDQGELEGLSLDELRAEHPQVLRLWLESPDLVVYPGGEAIVDAQKRIVTALAEVKARHPDGWVVIVSHQFVLSTLFAALLDIPLRRIRSLRFSPGSVSTITWDALGLGLTAFNSTRHLETEGS